MKPTKEPGPFMKVALARALGADPKSVQVWMDEAFYRREPEPERVTKEELRWGWPVQGSVS